MHLRALASGLLLALGAAAQGLTIQTSIPPTDVVGSTSTSTSSDDIMSIPQGETPITTPLTDPLLTPTPIAPTIQTSSLSNPPDVSPPPEMSIPSGETPLPSVTVTSPVTVPPNGTGTPTSTLNVTTKTLGTSPGPSQTSPNAAVPLVARGGGIVFSMALFGLAWII